MYPVLYLHDGQNLFDGRTSFVRDRTWQMREQADEVIGAGEVEPLVIVGIYNTGDRRLAEYTHEHNRQMGGGEADAYGDLVKHELMPWIASRYRVRQDRESTGMGGSSLGGLVTLYLGLRDPEVFGKLALLREHGMGGSSLGGLVTLYLGLRHPEVLAGWLAVAERLVEPQEHPWLSE